MTLLDQSVQVYAQLGKLFEAMRAGQAPEKFTREFLRDLDFKSSNHHAFIPLLKGLGFITAEGAPTQRYRDFLDGTKWRKVIAEALREAYSDVFVIKSRPTNADLDLIRGKYRSTFNHSDVMADRAARTFLALLEFADEETLYGTGRAALEPKKEVPDGVPIFETTPVVPKPQQHSPSASVGLHYNIQIHLPATKDVEVYGAIFKSLREHLLA